MIDTIERRSCVAGGLLKFLLIGLHVLQRIWRRQLIVLDRKQVQERAAAIGPPPLGKLDVTISHFAGFELRL